MAVAQPRATYAAAVAGFLPSGDAWPRDPGLPLDRLTQLIGGEMARVGQRVVDLLREADPRRTLEMLEDWEAEYGLPDECSPLVQTLQERRLALLARMVEVGGQSRPYFIEIATALGYPITITEFRPLQAGFHAGDTANGAEWAFAWRVNAPEVRVVEFRAGQSVAGEPLRSWGNASLECVIGRLKPAHTHVLFGYGS